MKILNWATVPPKSFLNPIHVSGCVCQCGDKILFLKRAPGTLQELTWGLPAGKLEPLETADQAVVRELYEETGIDISCIPLKKLDSLYLERTDLNVAFHIYQVTFFEIPSIHLLQKENIEARWLTLNEALKLPLIVGGYEAIQVISKHVTHV